jgi:hypothetical protein
VFCTNQSLPALERDKLKKANSGVEIDFFDSERIRVLLDTDHKKIRQVYLGIFDNTNIRNKIRNVLYDPQNEAEPLERWKILGLTTSLEAVGLFSLIKDKDLTEVAETQKELEALRNLRNSFLKLRKIATDIDNHVLKIVGQNMPNNHFIPYWKKIGEYGKLRLLGTDKKLTEKRIKTWNVSSDFNDCERLYEILVVDKDLQQLIKQFVGAKKDTGFSMDKVIKQKGFILSS